MTAGARALPGIAPVAWRPGPLRHPMSGVRARARTSRVDADFSRRGKRPGPGDTGAGAAMTGQAMQAGEPRFGLGLEDVDIPRLGMAAMRFIKAIELGQHDILWDAASESIRRAMGREAFVMLLAQRHGELGRGTRRRWAAVRVDQPTQRPQWQPGTYAVLEFSVAFGEAAAPHRETVTLRREDEGVWRLAGYAVKAA